MPPAPIVALHQILLHTPPFVWGLLALIGALGVAQMRRRRIGVARATLLPVAMTALSLWGTASLFGHAHLLVVLPAWIAGAALAFLCVAHLPTPPATAFDAAARAFTVPGSWAPLALMLGVFLLRYLVNVALAVHPELAADAPLAAATALASGAFAGVFAGRSARLWMLISLEGPRCSRA